jgi:hypothetical protein
MAETSKHFLALRTAKLSSHWVLVLSETVPELSETVPELSETVPVQELFWPLSPPQWYHHLKKCRMDLVSECKPTTPLRLRLRPC